MRTRFFISSVALLLASVSLPGCGSPTEPEGPEMGSVEAYLNEHPEEWEDDGNEAGDENEAFDAAS